MKDDGIWQLKTKLEAIYTANAVVLATGTFLGGRVYVGDVSYASGPDGPDRSHRAHPHGT